MMIPSNLLGDIHNGQFVKFGFYKGSRCIIKPRPASIERGFNSFLLQLEKEGFLFIPGKVKILEDTGKKHYVEITKHKRVTNDDDVRLFFNRCGVILFLAYIFSSNDLHRENIIANGSMPTIIDYETLFSADETRRSDDMYPVLLSESVWTSMLLPRWTISDNADVDVSGLTGRVLNNNKKVEFDENKNILFLNNSPVNAWEHVVDITDGFRYAYDFFMNRKAHAVEWLSYFANCEFRVIMRKTSVYNTIRKLIEDCNQEKREEIAEYLLSLAYINDIDPNRLTLMKKVLAEEVRAVSNGEVPLFTVNATNRDVCCDGEVLCAEYFKLSPLSKARKKIDTLCKENRDGQIRIIMDAMESVAPSNFQRSSFILNGGRIVEHTPEPVFIEPSYAFLPKECFEIYNIIENHYIKGMPDGWLYLSKAEKGPMAISGIGMGLYHGVSGIMCFYAAMYAKTGESVFLQKIKEIYEPIKRHLFHTEVCFNSNVAALNNGLGGILSALFHICELTHEMSFESDAEEIFDRLFIPDVLQQGNSDYLSGYAGFSQILRKTHNYKKAKKCADLLRQVLWNATPHLTGFAHGAAGYAYSLGILDKVLNDEKSSPKIYEILQWENQHYSTENRNWHDLRNPKCIGYMRGWCNGSPGIIMARKNLFSITRNEHIRELCISDISRVDNWFNHSNAPDHDCLCCGNAARLMVLSHLGIKAVSSYQNLLSAFKHNSLHLQHIINTNDFIPGLMQGYAGIGYAIAMYDDRRSGGMLV